MKDYPLNADCNIAVRTTLHPAACDAAVAVRLAQAHNKGEALEDYFYTHQQEMTPASVRQAARDIGGVTDFDAKYAATLALVKGDIALGQSLEGESDADLLPERRQDRWHVGTAVFRSGHRLRVETRSVRGIQNLELRIQNSRPRGAMQLLNS